jgi:hypothetical protein
LLLLLLLALLLLPLPLVHPLPLPAFAPLPLAHALFAPRSRSVLGDGAQLCACVLGDDVRIAGSAGIGDGERPNRPNDVECAGDDGAFDPLNEERRDDAPPGFSIGVGGGGNMEDVEGVLAGVSGPAP